MAIGFHKDIFGANWYKCTIHIIYYNGFPFYWKNSVFVASICFLRYNACHSTAASKWPPLFSLLHKEGTKGEVKNLHKKGVFIG